MQRSRIAAFPGFQSLLYATLALVLLRDIITGGVPAFCHDWNWPYLHVNFAAVVSYGTSAWLPNDLGAPNIYPTLLPLLVAEGALLQVLGAKFALIILLAALYFLAALGTYQFTRRLGCSEFWASFSGVMYVAAPSLFSQLIAGHLGDVVVYAAFPWLSAAFLRTGDTTASALRCGLAAMCCSVQPQGFILAAAAIIIFALWLRTRQAALIALAGLLAACGSLDVTLYGLLSPLRHHAHFIAQEHAVISWERVQSAGLLDALGARGYFAGYDHARWLKWAYPSAGWLFASLVIAFSIYGFMRKNRAIFALCTMFALGFVTLSGLKGPLAPVWARAFAVAEPTSVLRELFHAAPFVAFPIAVAAANVCGAIWEARGSLARPLGALIAAALFVLYSNPSLGGSGVYLHAYVPSKLDAMFLARLRQDARPFRFAVFPGRQPYVIDQDVGVDPLSYYPVGAHQPVFGYFPASIVAFAADRWLNGDTRSAFNAYSRMGVRYLLDRDSPRPAGDEQIPPSDRVPALRVDVHMPRHRGVTIIDADPLIRAGQVPLVLGGDFRDLVQVTPRRIVAFLRQKPPFITSTRNYELGPTVPEDVQIAFGCAAMHTYSPSWISANPLYAWVDAQRYGIAMPALDDALFPAVMSLARPRLAPSEPGWLFLTLSQDGKFHWQHSVQSYHGVHAVAAATEPQHRTCKLMPGTRSAAPPRIISASLIRDGVRGTFVSHGDAGAFALEENYDTGWALFVDGRRITPQDHFVADGYGNGWIVHVAPGIHTFAARYEPGRLFMLLLALQIVVWVIIVSGCAVSFRR